MTRSRRIDWTAIVLILLLAAVYGWTMRDVPFHPDESTHIYMSKDFASLLRRPLELSWDGELPLEDEQRIRAIDAPLAKYAIGLARSVFSVPDLEADWDWRLSWQENRSRGALPSREQLLVARAGLTWVLPFCLWFFYRSLSQVLPGIGSLAGTLLLGMHPLLLLHGRRAMSEALLLLGICLFLWAGTREKRNPWLIGLSLALAIGAKHSALGLLPAGIVAVVLLPDLAHNLNKAAANLLKLSLVLFLSLLILNPFYWRRPLAALQAGINARFELAGEQQQDHLGPDEGGLKTTVPGLVLNLFYTDPQTEEVGNYLDHTREDREHYLANRLHGWGRDWISGTVLFTLSLAGLGLAAWNHPKKTAEEKEKFLIVFLATLGMGAFSAFLLPWQRYAAALLPLVIFWITAGAEPFLRAADKAWPRKKQRPNS